MSDAATGALLAYLCKRHAAATIDYLGSDSDRRP